MISNIAENSNKKEARQMANDHDAIVILMSEALSDMEDVGIKQST